MSISLNKILVFDRKNIPEKYLKESLALKVEQKALFKDFKVKYMKFLTRGDCEKNPDFKQIIPYIIVNFRDKIALYQRNGSENRLHDKYSIGVGGHVELRDYIPNALEATVENAIYRELEEEFADFNFYDTQLHFLGVINEEITEVGVTHIGFVYMINTLKQFKPGSELKNLDWLTLDQINVKDLELWSRLALELIN